MLLAWVDRDHDYRQREEMLGEGNNAPHRFAHSRRVVKEQESAPLEPTILVSFLAGGCSVESSVQLDGIVAQPRILGESISFSPYTGSDS